MSPVHKVDKPDRGTGNRLYEYHSGHSCNPLYSCDFRSGFRLYRTEAMGKHCRRLYEATCGNGTAKSINVIAQSKIDYAGARGVQTPASLSHLNGHWTNMYPQMCYILLACTVGPIDTVLPCPMSVLVQFRSLRTKEIGAAVIAIIILCYVQIMVTVW